MKKHTLVLSCFVLLVITAPLFGQNVRPLVVYAEGKGFTLIRGGQEQFVDFSVNKPIGFELKAGDIINVEARTTFEIQLFPTMTVIKVSESSSFVIKKVDADGNYDIEVSYGRLRTRIDEKNQRAFFIFNGVDITADAAGTDFGYDRVFSGGKVIEPAIYCFGGALAVSGPAAAGSSTLKIVKLVPQELVTVVRAANGDIDLIKTGLKPDVKSFWQKNDFQTRPTKTPVAVTEPENPTSKEPVPVPTEKERLLSGYVDNTENGLGAREKFSAVGEKDLVVNPDFSAAKETESETTAPPAETKEAAKETPPEEDTAAVAEADKKEAEKETTEQQGGGAPAVGFQMDLGLAVNYLYYFTPPGLTPIPTLEWITDFLEFLMRFQAGLILDVEIMFFNIFGFGVESGFLYNEVTLQNASYQPYLIHFFTIPLFFNIRFTLGPLFIQPHAGIVIPGSTLNGSLQFGDFVYEAGGKLGLRLGGLTIYVNVGLVSPTLEGVFSGGADFYFGGGLLFKIF